MFCKAVSRLRQGGEPPRASILGSRVRLRFSRWGFLDGEPPPAGGLARVRGRRFVSTRLPRFARNDNVIRVYAWFYNVNPYKSPLTPLKFVIPRERSDRGNLAEAERKQRRPNYYNYSCTIILVFFRRGFLDGEPPPASGLARVRGRRFVSTRLPRFARNDNVIRVYAWFYNVNPYKSPLTPLKFVIPRERSDRGNLAEAERKQRRPNYYNYSWTVVIVSSAGDFSTTLEMT